MKNKKSDCKCACENYAAKILDQNSKLIEQIATLIQINNEQNAQINHLLESLEQDQEEATDQTMREI